MILLVVRGDSGPYPAILCAAAVDPTGLSDQQAEEAWMQEDGRRHYVPNPARSGPRSNAAYPGGSTGRPNAAKNQRGGRKTVGSDVGPSRMLG